MLKTATLIVVHNHRKHLDKLISSLSAQNYKEVYFCDAASSDGSKELLEKSVYKNNLLSKRVLESFSKNNNDLIKHFNLDANYYFVLNPDTFFDMDVIGALIKEARLSKKTAILAPKILNADSTVQKSWKIFPSIGKVVLKRLGLRRTSNEPEIVQGNIAWALGAALLVKKEFIDQRGYLFDERYRLYGEDIDICFAAHVNKWEVKGTNNVLVFHSLNEMSSKKLFSKYNIWNITSIFKFYIKWAKHYAHIRKSVNSQMSIVEKSNINR